MKKTLIIVGLIGLAIAATSTGSRSESQSGNGALEKEIVQKAIQESTRAYDERQTLAMVAGAQSGREPKKSTKLSREIGRASHIFRNAYKSLISTHSMSHTTALDLLREALPSQCQSQLQTLDCDPDAKYRTVDGSCNNLAQPLWGATHRPLARLVEPSYMGDMDDPRGGFDSTASSLPAPRQVSLRIHSGNGESVEAKVTHMVAQFGQFLDHDITLTPVTDPDCCDNTSASEDCWRIVVDPADSFYGGRNVTCLNFVRSTPYCFPTASKREQMNAITAFIDGSVVYGSDPELAEALREKKGGRLIENSEHKGFLPWRSDVYGEGESKEKVVAGDVRADEMPGLATLQSLFLREHNRLAGQLSSLQPEWNDSTLFQETRRLIAASLQQITYAEFLPAVLGPEAMSQHGILLPSADEIMPFTKYDPLEEPTIYNSFATAAYRFGHTLVNGLIKLYLGSEPKGTYRVRNNYGMIRQVVEKREGTSGYDLILNGLIRQEAQKFDPEIHEDMTNYLFAMAEGIGQDLAARNVQRGRDHGIPSYNQFRKAAGLQPLPTSWEGQKPEEISEVNWGKLKQVYGSSSGTPEDIDLYTGGLCEQPEEGALSGKTFLFIQGLQFRKLMKGDRFFFTHEGESGSFSKEQVQALRGRTLGDIICDNSELEETPRNVFYKADAEENPMISCKDPSRKFDLELFAKGVDEGTTENSNPPSSSTAIAGSGLLVLITAYLLSRV